MIGACGPRSLRTVGGASGVGGPGRGVNEPAAAAPCQRAGSVFDKGAVAAGGCWLFPAIAEDRAAAAGWITKRAGGPGRTVASARSAAAAAADRGGLSATALAGPGEATGQGPGPDCVAGGR